MLFAQYTGKLDKKFGVEKAVNMLSDAGFPAVDITMDNLQSPTFADDFRGLADSLFGIAKERKITYIQAHAPVGRWDYYIENVIPMLPTYFEFVGMLGIPNIVVHPIMRGVYYHDRERMFWENVEFYKSVAPAAKKYGVKIAIENMWDRHRVTKRIVDCVGADPNELVRMYEVLNDPDAFTICLDIGHVALCGREPEDAVRVIGRELLGCIHAHDNDYVEDMHVLPGFSKINFDRVCRALGEINYKGGFTLEAGGTYENFEDAQLPTVLKFMADTTKYLCEKVDSYRIK